MNSVDLLPCPFCNSNAVFVFDEDEDGRYVCVQCCSCGCGSGKHYPLMDDARPNAANEWNRRVHTMYPDCNAVLDIIKERHRQLEVEGWSAEHDDEHDKGQLAAAAACYAIGRLYADLWPFALSWWKPTDRRRDLVRAGALIMAEIARLDRASAKAEEEAAND